MTTITLTKKNISVTITSSTILTSGYYHDGNPWVVVGTGTADITSYSPAQATIPSGGGSAMINGAVKNPRGHAVNGSGSSWQGVDQRGGSLYPYTATLTVSVPITCSANDVVVIARSDPIGPNGHSSRPGYVSIGSARSVILEEMVVTFLSAVPASPTLRPSAFGPSTGVRKVANLSNINYTNIPQFITPIPSGNPSYDYLIQVFSDFCGELMTGWNTDGITPDLQHPGYGQYTAGIVSQALCKILEIPTTINIVKREQLILKLTQWGIDLWGAFKDGRINYSNGGHMQGRKALIMLAGIVLNDADLIDPDTSIGSNPTGYGLTSVFTANDLGVFQEKHAYRNRLDQDISIWYGGRWVHIYNDGGMTSSTLAALLKDTPGTTWLTSATKATHRIQYSYSGDETVGAQIGTALFMMAVKRTNEWSKAAVGFVTQNMQGFNNQIALDYTNHLLDLNGTVVVNGERVFSSNAPANGSYCSDLWRVYAFTDDFVINSISKYHGTIGRTTPFLTTNDKLEWGTTVTLEIMNAPKSGVTTTELYFGDLQNPPTDLDGADLYVSNQSLFGGAVVISEPNEYGMLLFSVTLPAQPAGVQMQLTLQVVFTTSATTKVSTNAIEATLQ